MGISTSLLLRWTRWRRRYESIDICHHATNHDMLHDFECNVANNAGRVLLHRKPWRRRDGTNAQQPFHDVASRWAVANLALQSRTRLWPVHPGFAHSDTSIHAGAVQHCHEMLRTSRRLLLCLFLWSLPRMSNGPSHGRLSAWLLLRTVLSEMLLRTLLSQLYVPSHDGRWTGPSAYLLHVHRHCHGLLLGGVAPFTITIFVWQMY